MSRLYQNEEDDCLALIHNDHHDDEELSESTPLFNSTHNTISDPQQPRVVYKRQKQIYSAVTLADIFLKVVYTTIVTSFLLFCYSYVDLPYEGSLIAFYLFCICSGLLLCIINLNTDQCSSKQRFITIGFLIYVIGLAALSAVTSYDLFDVPRRYQYLCIIPLVLISVGDSVCKSCIGDFTRTQFAGENISEKLNDYLIKLFWIGHVGAFFIVMVLLAILEYTRFDLGYGLCSVCILAGLVAFCSAWSHYEEPPLHKSTFVKLVWTILKEANKKSKEEVVKERPYFEDSMSRPELKRHWLDYAKHSAGGSIPDSAVDQTKSFFRVSLLFLSFVPYWVCNAQSYSTFIYQGFHLNRQLGDFHIPIAWVALIHVAAVLMLAKLLDLVIYPCLRRRGATFPTGWRIIAGMCFGILSMICAAIVEYVSHKLYTASDNPPSFQMVGNVNVTYVEEVHIFWLIPQFAFLGISEVLVGLAGLGMGCKLCKGLLQKGVTSMYHFTVVMGHFISLVIIVCGWFPSGKMLENYEMAIYFLCLAACCFVSFLLFLIVINKLEFTRSPMVTTYQSVSRSQDAVL